MNLKDIIGKRLTNIFVETRLNINGMDESDVLLELDNKTIISFPWEFNDSILEKTIPKNFVSVINRKSPLDVKNKKIIDFINFEDPISTGFFELENGLIVYEQTMFPTGAMATGFCIYPNIETFVEENGENYLKFSNYL